MRGGGGGGRGGKAAHVAPQRRRWRRGDQLRSFWARLPRAPGGPAVADEDGVAALLGLATSPGAGEGGGNQHSKNCARDFLAARKIGRTSWTDVLEVCRALPRPHRWRPVRLCLPVPSARVPEPAAGGPTNERKPGSPCRQVKSSNKLKQAPANIYRRSYPVRPYAPADPPPVRSSSPASVGAAKSSAELFHSACMLSSIAEVRDVFLRCAFETSETNRA